MNSDLEDIWRHFVAPERQSWDLLLSVAELSMNNRCGSSIQSNAFQLSYGKSCVQAAAVTAPLL